MSKEPRFTFAINSVGGSTNRFSKHELPFFGGVISSRMGEIIESAKHTGGVLTEKINDSFEFKSPSDQSHRKGNAVAVIDYSQNFLHPPMGGLGSALVNIKKGSIEHGKDGFTKSGFLQGKKKKAIRPQSSGRYISK